MHHPETKRWIVLVQIVLSANDMEYKLLKIKRKNIRHESCKDNGQVEWSSFRRRLNVGFIRSIWLAVLAMVLIGTVSAGGGENQLLKSDELLSCGYERATYRDWSIYVSDATVFVPMEPGLPDPFTFDDLLPGMATMVHGFPYPGQNIVNADVVMVFMSMHQSIPHRNSPPCHDEVFGEVSYVLPDQSMFEIWANGHQGEYIDVKVLPGSEFWEAKNGDPRIPLNSIFDFDYGDPIMIHGFRYQDMYRGSVFVKSTDWFPQEKSSGFEIMELYGWVDNIYSYGHGELYVTIWLDTLTGDPNHQTFSKSIGPDGGMVFFPWGHLNFPEGALNDVTEITVTGDFMFWWTLQNIYEFHPSMNFNVPVDVELRYFNLDQIDPERVKLVFYNEETQKWQIACHMTHFPEEHCFRGQIDHFSRYSLSTNNRPLQGTTLQPN